MILPDTSVVMACLRSLVRDRHFPLMATHLLRLRLFAETPSGGTP